MIFPDFPATVGTPSLKSKFAKMFNLHLIYGVAKKKID